MGEFGRSLAHWLVSQDVHEDICGVALESKWLSRSSDPAQGRASLYSAHDIVVPPYSGVRGRTPRPSPIAPTAQAPVSTPPGKLDRTKLAIGIAVAVAVLTTIIFALTGPSQNKPEASPSAAARVVPAVAPEVTPPAKSEAPKEPERAPSPPPPPPAADSAATAQPRAGHSVRKGGAAKPAPAAQSSAPIKKSAPGDDLLSP
jgi:hypothetical protein